MSDIMFEFYLYMSILWLIIIIKYFKEIIRMEKISK